MTDGSNQLPQLADDLDELRRLAGLSYRDLARRTGCARSTLNDALTARRFPGLDTVLAVVRACGGDSRVWRARWAAAKRGRPPQRAAPLRLERHIENSLMAWARLNGLREPFVVVVPAPRQPPSGDR